MNGIIKNLLYKLLAMVIQDTLGDTVRPSEEFNVSELLDLIKNFSGSDPTLEEYIKIGGFDLKEWLEEKSDLSDDELRDSLLEDFGLPSELVKESDLNWLKGQKTNKTMNKTKKPKDKAKVKDPEPKPVIVTKKKEVKLENVLDLLKTLYRVIIGIKCGDSVKLEALFSDEKLSECFLEVLGKKPDLFDIYSEKQVSEDLLWDYDDDYTEESLKEFLVDEKEIPECLLSDEALERLTNLEK